ncbi:MAG TPA: hypothetical protein VFZ25_13685 [Chloroflexota bacterium]|nr:hypothetical protein [Chloroflexota bacterium]
MYEERLDEVAARGDSDRLNAARVRSSLRRVEAQIARIHSEQRLFRRCNFGSEVHQIQLTALNAERAELLTRLARLQPRRRRRRAGVLSWLLLPPTLAGLAVRSLFPRRDPGLRIPLTGI